MNEILQANVFFFITSISVVLFTLLLCVAVYQAIRILKSIRRIVDRIDEGSEMIADDMENLRTFVVEGSLVSQLVGFFLGNRAAFTRTKKRKSKKTETED
ncbi:MAG: hypothetical protein ACI9H6_000138 [Patiriisocius sp.]|jgi:membrane protein DedA with SNARE-associated domain